MHVADSIIEIEVNIANLIHITARAYSAHNMTVCIVVHNLSEHYIL